MVVIDIGTPPATEPWLEETTYLIDSSGHTTAIVAQTDQPTAGVALQPIPFTPANRQALNNPSATRKSTELPTATTSPGITPAPNPTATSTSATPTLRNSPPITIVAGAAVGAALVLIITGAVVYLLQRRSKRNRRRIDDRFEMDNSWDDEKTGSPDSFDSWDTLGVAQSARAAEREERHTHGLKSLQEMEKDYKIFNSMTDRDRHALLEYEARNNRILRKDQAESGSLSTIAALPQSGLQQQTSREARDHTDRGTAHERAGPAAQPAQPAQPASILKRPAHEGTQDAVRGEFDSEHTPAESPNNTGATAQRARKVVNVRRDDLNRISIVDRWIGRISRASMVSDDSEG